jgi:hypothetical protein
VRPGRGIACRGRCLKEAGQPHGPWKESQDREQDTDYVGNGDLAVLAPEIEEEEEEGNLFEVTVGLTIALYST